jgi:hypothetical protein
MSSATTCARIKTFKLLRRRGRSRRRFHYYFVAQFEFYRVARLPAAYRYVGSLAEAVFKFRAQVVTALPSKKSKSLMSFSEEARLVRIVDSQSQ